LSYTTYPECFNLTVMIVETQKFQRKNTSLSDNEQFRVFIQQDNASREVIDSIVIDESVATYSFHRQIFRHISINFSWLKSVQISLRIIGG
jgi:hypothetical protein